MSYCQKAKKEIEDLQKSIEGMIEAVYTIKNHADLAEVSEKIEVLKSQFKALQFKTFEFVDRTNW